MSGLPWAGEIRAGGRWGATEREVREAAKEWQGKGWTLLKLDEGDDGWSFVFASRSRPAWPPRGIEPTSAFVGDHVLFCRGRPWKVGRPVAELLTSAARRYDELLRDAGLRRVEPTAVAADKQALTRSLADQHLRDQIRVETIGMAARLGLLGT